MAEPKITETTKSGTTSLNANEARTEKVTAPDLTARTVEPKTVEQVQPSKSIGDIPGESQR